MSLKELRHQLLEDPEVHKYYDELRESLLIAEVLIDIQKQLEPIEQALTLDINCNEILDVRLLAIKAAKEGRRLVIGLEEEVQREQ